MNVITNAGGEAIQKFTKIRKGFWCVPKPFLSECGEYRSRTDYLLHAMRDNVNFIFLLFFIYVYKSISYELFVYCLFHYVFDFCLKCSTIVPPKRVEHGINISLF